MQVEPSYAYAVRAGPYRGGVLVRACVQALDAAHTAKTEASSDTAKEARAGAAS